MADALLDDLDELSDVEPEDEPAYADEAREVSGGDVGDATAGDGGDAAPPEDGNDVATGATMTIKPRPRLLDDPSLKSHLHAVRVVTSLDGCKRSSGAGSHVTPKEEGDREHALILASNKHLVSLGHEIHRTHLELCSQYHPKFPELEELLTDTFQYRAAIGIIQNEMDVTKVNDELNNILTSNQIITITVAGSTTSGRPLAPDELEAVNATCRLLDNIRSTQAELTDFVEARMERWSPSVCALVGPAVAARLLAAAGGLAELAKIPACNLQLVGKTRSTAASRGGMATQGRTQHAVRSLEGSCVTHGFGRSMARL